MDVVILAAGYGTRLNNNLPKGLIKINDESIVESNIKRIHDVTKINKIIVVTNRIFENSYKLFLEKLEIKHETIINESVERGNGYSLFLAEKGISTNKFIMIMSDHLFSKAFIRRAISGSGLAVDKAPIYYDLEDATKVLVDSKGYVKSIGKNLTKFNYIDTGFFILDKSIFEVIKGITNRQKKVGVSDIIRESRCKTVDVTGNFWIDIDTQLDLEVARTRTRRSSKIINSNG
jgi:choline kinase